MARIHPTTPLSGPLNSGDYRERDVLRILAAGLPDSFDVFHNLPWSSIHKDTQHFGELDLVIISPVGHILLIEVKAGEINEGVGFRAHGGGLFILRFGRAARRVLIFIPQLHKLAVYVRL